MPTVPSTMGRITMPAPGVAGAPMDAPTEVSTMSVMPPMPISMPYTWARKIAATPWYRAVPFMLMVAPRGMTIIWISARNSLPGKASQSAMVLAVAGSVQPVVGPIRMPVVMPRIMPITTCSHNLPAHQRLEIAGQVVERATMQDLDRVGLLDVLCHVSCSVEIRHAAVPADRDT